VNFSPFASATFFFHVDHPVTIHGTPHVDRDALRRDVGHRDVEITGRSQRVEDDLEVLILEVQ